MVYYSLNLSALYNGRVLLSHLFPSFLHVSTRIIQARRAAKAGADTIGSVPDGTAAATTASLDDSASASTGGSSSLDGNDATDNSNDIVIPSSKTMKPHPIVTPPPSHSHFGTHGRTPNPLTTHDVYHASPSSGNYTASFSNLRQTMAPHSTDARTAGDAHLAMALRDIPFEAAGGPNVGTAYPGVILYGSYDGQERRGQDFVKLDHEERWTKRRGRGRARRRAQKAQKVVFLQQILWNNFVRGLERLGIDVAPMLGVADENEKGEKEEDAKGDGAEQSPDDSSTSRAERALHHLVKASELGNPLAQTLVAQSLASGILPVALPPPSSTPSGEGPKGGVEGNLTVPTDFAHGGSQLSRALVLWHSAAMGGSAEAALAMGYRAKYSAGMGNHHEKDKFVLDRSLRIAATAEKIAEYKRSGMSEDEATKRAHREEANTNPRAETRTKVIVVDGSQVLTEEKIPTEDTRQPTNAKGAQKDDAAAATLHPPSATSHYGLLGTCESALAYYETAAHLSMDEMEASELRGKVNPATDSHKLPIIHAHGGASSALSHSNKPDELEEAIQYYRLRAYAKPDADINAAYTLAQLYHHGLRGVKQSMSLALEYYSIAAEAGSWEAAGQAGKFHLWGMGVNETQRDLNLAYRYFKMGTPGGVEGCLKRWNGKKGSKAAHAAARRKKQKRKKKKEREAAAAAAAKKDQEGAATDGGNVASGATETGDDGATDSDTAEDDSWVDEEEDESWDDFDQCDHPCVNGMGLLYLFGVPMVLPPSREVATKYFNLARDMGNMDASYSLAMMRLGWMDEIGARTSQRQYKDVGAINDAKKGVFTPSRHARDGHGLTADDFKFALNEFNRASGRGHLQAKHRLGMLYAKGVKIVDKGILEIVGIENEHKVTAVAVPQNCPMALAFYKVVAENGLSMTRRIRAAYKQYVAGDYVSSLRNYLAAAESGNVVAQINAAFLLERGTCLGLSTADCTSAAVRMWRAAARQGDVEACLRVGDFYYYGRLLGAGTDSGGSKQRKSKSGDEPSFDSDKSHSRLPGSEYKIGYAIGPYPWIRYVLYPEDLFFLLRKKTVAGVRLLLGKKKSKGGSPSSRQTCPSGLQGSAGTCSAPDDPSTPWLSKLSKEDGQDQDQMALAARYYRMAAEEHDSARANFNLGFMHEWGLGLKQDFPLAKRHYDLCGASRHGEAELSVQVALLAMDWHQQVVRWRLAWGEWRESGTIAGPFGKTQAFVFRSLDKLSGRKESSAGDTTRDRNDARKTSSSASNVRSFDDIMLSHIFSRETFVAALLAIFITRLLVDRIERQQRARRRQ